MTAVNQTLRGDAGPWTALFTVPRPDFPPIDHSLRDVFAAAVALAGDGPAVHYFDRRLSYRELDAQADAFAAVLVDGGFAPGDRLALVLQNVPQFLIATIAAWKAGGIAVPISPMSRAFELGRILPDCRPAAIVVHNDLVAHVDAALALLPDLSSRVFVTSPRCLQSRDDDRVLPAVLPAGDHPEMVDLIERAAGRSVVPPPLGSDDVAMIVYTSGTTGMPKGAMLTHRNIIFNARSVVVWWGLERGEGPILGLAPLFHVTGLVGHVAAAFQYAEALVLTYRFQPEVMLDAMIEYRPAFTAGAITAFTALIQSPESTRDHYRSLRTIVTGGAPVPPAALARFEELSGCYLHNGYGLTETAAGLVSVPVGRRAPIDPEHDTLSIGIPNYDIELWVADEAGRPVPQGEIGELVVRAPGVSPGYWERPDATAELMRPEGFHTGDVGFIDAEGWVYLVDRKKDMIVASGFKVWPREVEDVLYAHPAVREAAVVGIPHPYRGETVRAVVSLRAGQSAGEGELMDWCRDRMATYKVPREVQIIDELPKTISGKILRRELR